jgi:hypothetical protein
VCSLSRVAVKCRVATFQDVFYVSLCFDVLRRDVECTLEDTVIWSAVAYKYVTRNPHFNRYCGASSDTVQTSCFSSIKATWVGVWPVRVHALFKFHFGCGLIIFKEVSSTFVFCLLDSGLRGRSVSQLSSVLSWGNYSICTLLHPEILSSRNVSASTCFVSPSTPVDTAQHRTLVMSCCSYAFCVTVDVDGTVCAAPVRSCDSQRAAIECGSGVGTVVWLKDRRYRMRQK